MKPGICAPYRIEIARNKEQRAALQAFIRQVYLREFGARIPHFLPNLIGLYQADGQLVAACGLNLAASGPLYLEKYLDQPIEDLLTRHYSTQANRSNIMEVGNLAASNPGNGRMMFAAICLLLGHNGFDWVAFTGTTRLRNSFRHLSFDPVELGEASASQVGGDAVNWGRYYEHHPKVMAGDLSRGRRILASNSMLHALFEPMPELFPAPRRMAS
jgi:hypothetical protein